MNSELSLLLLSIGAALVAGVILGLLVSALFRRGSARPAPGVAPAGAEILRIDGDPVARKLVLRLAGAPLATADSIADPEVREHVRALMQLLALDAETASLPAMASPTAPMGVVDSPADTAPASPAASSSTAPELRVDVASTLPGLGASTAASIPDDLSGSFFTRLKTSLGPQPEVTPLKRAPVSVARMAKGQPAPKPPAEIFEQINALLQRNLAAQPDAPDIELSADGGELRILVGTEVFHQVEDVTDERARGWIREAVAEWEAG